MRYITPLLAVFIVLACAAGAAFYRLSSSPYWSEILTGLTVASLCLIFIVGIAVGAYWTAISIRAGTRWTAPLYMANERTESERLRTLRDALKIFPPHPGSLPPQQEQHAWLPPLTDFNVVDEDPYQ